jgi:hypothetical protein
VAESGRFENSTEASVPVHPGGGELRARLEAARKTAEISTSQNQAARLPYLAVLEAVGRFEILKARVVDERNRLADELERIGAEHAVQQVAIRKAVAVRNKFRRTNTVVKGTYSFEQLEEVDSAVDLEQARLNLIEVRLKQTRRRLAEVDDALKSVPVPKPGAPVNPPSGDKPPTTPPAPPQP